MGWEDEATLKQLWSVDSCRGGQPPMWASTTSRQPLYSSSKHSSSCGVSSYACWSSATDTGPLKSRKTRGSVRMAFITHVTCKPDPAALYDIKVRWVSSTSSLPQTLTADVCMLSMVCRYVSSAGVSFTRLQALISDGGSCRQPNNGIETYIWVLDVYYVPYARSGHTH